jgi:hypothetical protein
VPSNASNRRLRDWRSKPAQPAFASGITFLMTPNTATPSAISGTPLNKSSPQKPRGVSEKNQEKPPISNDGTPRDANELAGMFDKRCPFPNLMSLIICSPRGFLLSRMSVSHFPSNHYRNVNAERASSIKFAEFTRLN